MNEKQKKRLSGIVAGAVIAASYFILTYVSGILGIAFGPIQFRISEILTVLPVFTPWAIPGLTVGCLFSNLGSPYGIIDIVCGTAATFIAALLTWLLRKVSLKGFQFLAFLPPVLVNALVVGAEVAYTTPDVPFGITFWATALSVGAGEAVVLAVLGVPFYIFMKKKKIDLTDFSQKNEK